MLLQSVMIQNTLYDTGYEQFKITIPKKISDDLGLKKGQKVYITDDGGKVEIHLSNKNEGIPIIITKNRTRIYNSMEYFTTRICIPLAVVKSCNLEKKDDFYFENTENSIIMHPSE